MKKLFIAALLAPLLASLAFAALKPNEPAPAFSLPDRQGKEFYLTDVVGPSKKEQGSGVMLSFFASWCAPCRQELPLINSFADELKKKSIMVVLVDVKEDVETMNALLAELKVDKPLVLNDRYGKASEKYGIRFLPATFFIGADGKIKDIIFGEIQSEKELKEGAGKLVK